MSSILSSQVRVGVRVRPVSIKDHGSENVVHVDGHSVALSGRRFTYDHVFDTNTTQSALYEQVSPQLLQSFLEGYNATIMVYGQTGSGKTFTMGSEAHTELHQSSSTGLIPRFMHDLFQNLEDRGVGEYQISTSFLEVYGEDVHDLLVPERKSLPLREDASNSVICPGLTAKTVKSATEALAVLHEGTLNRTTAATLMNLTSSRSHAVFTVTLQQHTTSSRFTFVDLAGSERLKKTGCSGERAREGIEINKGLLALGNVINALADEERHQKKLHVPYRQSKLTRLLQDALGGNSQTLFLACVSGADTNASETLSTLHYANRARNIQNAPCRNVDPNTVALHQLQAYTSVLQAELIKAKFVDTDNAYMISGQVSDELMKQKDVNEYLDQLQVLAQQKVGATISLALHQPLAVTSAGIGATALAPASPADKLMPTEANQSVLENFDPAMLDEVNPDEELAILDQLLDLHQHDQDFEKEQKMDNEKLKQVEGELVEQEQLLLQLRDSLKVYHNMKAKYEKLVAEVQQLEIEKAQLEEQLQKATADPTLGCSRSIKKEMEMVERNLARARNETQRHRQMYKKAEQEAQKCRVMERKIAELKVGRANLIKKQKEAALRHREMTEKKTREIVALKRKDRNAERQLTKLQNDIQMHKRNIEKRQAYCRKITEQKKQTEEHLMKLLAMRQRELRQRTSRNARSGETQQSKTIKQEAFAPENEAIDSIRFLLEKEISESAMRADLKVQYEERMVEYSEAMRDLVASVKELEESDDESISYQDLELTVQELELKVELSSDAMTKIRRRLDRIEEQDNVNDGEAIKNLIKNQTSPVLRTVLLGTVEKLVDSELQRQRLSKTLDLKESVAKSFEKEVDSLNGEILELKNELAQRHSVIVGSVDPVQAMEKLNKENGKVLDQLEKALQERIALERRAEDLNKDYSEMSKILAETKEKLSLAEVAIAQSGGVHAPDDVLQKLQSFWNELGVPLCSREEARRQIEHCLEDTCARKLQEAEQLQVETARRIHCVRQNIVSMCVSLEMDHVDFEDSQNMALLQQLEELQNHQLRLKPIYDSAIERRNALVKQVTDVTVSLGISNKNLGSELNLLLADASGTEKESRTNKPVKLSDEFLSRCEASLSVLRLQKSKILSANAKMQKQAFSLVSAMGITESELLALVVHSIKRNGLPNWWNNDCAETVARAVSNEGGVVRSSMTFSQHLETFSKSLEGLSKGRRELSSKLRSVIERAQKTLLSTVDGEFDANEAYSTIHEKLFRLPPLSQDFIHSCVSEIEALWSGVDAMTQSEIEAITLVWEALNISPTKRGKFWESIDESLRAIQSQVVGPFDSVLRASALDGEEWVLSVVKENTKIYRELELGLCKLEKIHAEVERLRVRQDAKSKIISLDSEVQILSSKLKEFEDKQCSKQRLTTKKSTSSNLLREERFRKHMQAKFTAKLDQLGSLLSAWTSNEKKEFDQSLLSQDARDLLQNSGRKEFMYLRTVEYKGPATKRGADTIDNRDDTCAPPAKRHASSTMASVARTATGSSAKAQPLPKASPSSKSSDEPRSSPRKVVARNDSLLVKRSFTSSQNFVNLPPSEHDNSKRSRSNNSTRPPLSREAHLSSRSTNNCTSVYPLKAGASARLTLDPFGMVLGEASLAKENPAKDKETDS